MVNTMQEYIFFIILIYIFLFYPKLYCKRGDKMNEMVKIIHNDYEKISDTCMWLSNEFMLKFNVELNKHSDKYGKSNFHKEIGYQVNGEYRVNIIRDFIYYLSIESIHRSAEGNKLQLRITINDIYFLKYKLEEVIQWFINKKYENLFMKKDGRIINTIKVDPIIVNLAFNNYIEFEPSIFSFENSPEQITGVKVYLNSDNISFFMNVNILFGFKYFIDTFNMYQSAQNMLNYLGRPDNGTNYTGYEQNYKQIKESQSFFNRVNAERKN